MPQPLMIFNAQRAGDEVLSRWQALRNRSVASLTHDEHAAYAALLDIVLECSDFNPDLPVVPTKSESAVARRKNST